MRRSAATPASMVLTLISLGLHDRQHQDFRRNVCRRALWQASSQSRRNACSRQEAGARHRPRSPSTRPAPGPSGRVRQCEKGVLVGLVVTQVRDGSIRIHSLSTVRTASPLLGCDTRISTPPSNSRTNRQARWANGASPTKQSCGCRPALLREAAPMHSQTTRFLLFQVLKTHTVHPRSHFGERMYGGVI